MAKHIFVALLCFSSAVACASVPPVSAFGRAVEVHTPEAAALVEELPPIAPSAPKAKSEPAPLPAGESCLAKLTELGIAFRTLPERRGVETPIIVEGPIGGVRYHAYGAVPLICDCRLALALFQVSPLLTSLDITGARFSGAYVYRRTRSGRPSLHARGLAIDIHELSSKSGRFSVKHDFERGLPEPCGPGLPLLNTVACRLRASSLFRELLTPDSDPDHHDHFHLGIAQKG